MRIAVHIFYSYTALFALIDIGFPIPVYWCLHHFTETENTTTKTFNVKNCHRSFIRFDLCKLLKLHYLPFATFIIDAAESYFVLKKQLNFEISNCLFFLTHRRISRKLETKACGNNKLNLS